jgi:predicted dinucleotide-binding enzyme
VPSEVLFGVYEAKRKDTQPSLVYCGDDESAKKTAAKLIRDVGFDPVNSGPLRMARYMEPFLAADRPARIRGGGRPGTRVPFRAV